MSDKIFELEQQIMNAWNVVDDIEMLYHYFGDNPKFEGLDAKAEDEMMNLLLGVKSMYALKFEKLFKTFEDVCGEHHRRGNRIKELEEHIRILSNERESFDDEEPILKQHNDYLMREWQQMQESFDFVEHEAQEREDKAQRRSTSTCEWNEDRMDIIGQNGNDGLHYATSYSIDDATPHEWDQAMRSYWKNHNANV